MPDCGNPRLVAARAPRPHIQAPMNTDQPPAPPLLAFPPGTRGQPEPPLRSLPPGFDGSWRQLPTRPAHLLPPAAPFPGIPQPTPPETPSSPAQPRSGGFAVEPPQYPTPYAPSPPRSGGSAGGTPVGAAATSASATMVRILCPGRSASMFGRKCKSLLSFYFSGTNTPKSDVLVLVPGPNRFRIWAYCEGC